MAGAPGGRPARGPVGPPGRRSPPGGGLGPRSTSAPGDAVLYENDLPDHYP